MSQILFKVDTATATPGAKTAPPNFVQVALAGTLLQGSVLRGAQLDACDAAGKRIAVTVAQLLVGGRDSAGLQAAAAGSAATLVVQAPRTQASAMAGTVAVVGRGQPLQSITLPTSAAKAAKRATVATARKGKTGVPPAVPPAAPAGGAGGSGTAVPAPDVRPMSGATGVEPIGKLQSLGDVKLFEGGVVRAATLALDHYRLMTDDQRARLNWRTRPIIGLCLQGGAMKGAFTAGALHYLAHDGFIGPQKTLRIAAASIGSITSALVQENKGTATTIKGVRQYMAIERPDHLLNLRPEVETILKGDSSGQLRALVKSVLNQEEVTFDPSAYLEHNQNVVGWMVDTARDFRLSHLRTDGLMAPLAMFLQKGASDLAQPLQRLMKVKLSLARLAPVEKKLNDRAFLEAVNPAASIHMSVVSLKTGALCYIRLAGGKFTLLYPKVGYSVGEGYSHALEDYDEFAINWIAGDDNLQARPTVDARASLVKAALASGAFPALFAPQEIDFTRTGRGGANARELFTDGGVRENMPLKILSQQARDIIAIHCSPVEFEDQQFGTRGPTAPTWSNIGMLAVDIQSREGDREDFAVGRPLNVSSAGSDDSEANVIHIAPLVPTLGLTETSHFKVKTTIWYGYMRAADEMLITQYLAGAPEANQAAIIQLRELGTTIYGQMLVLFEAAKKLASLALYTTQEPKPKHIAYPGMQVAPFDASPVLTDVALPLAELHQYLIIKHNLLGALHARAHDYREVLQRVLPAAQVETAVRKTFLYGDTGFMNRRMYLDWMGVYEHLEQAELYNNPRVRMIGAFSRTMERITAGRYGELHYRVNNNARARLAAPEARHKAMAEEVIELFKNVAAAVRGAAVPGGPAPLLEGNGLDWNSAEQPHYSREAAYVIERGAYDLAPKDRGYLSLGG